MVSEFISLDGVIEEPKWTFQFNLGEEGDQFKQEELAADVQLLGRVPNHGLAEAWPKMRASTGAMRSRATSWSRAAPSSHSRSPASD